MRLMRLFMILLVPLAACDVNIFGPDGGIDAPSTLNYQLIPSGDPTTPSGVLLTWGIPRSGRASTFDIFGRTKGGDWLRRATTTSPTFHDAGSPQDQYYVSARNDNGTEIGRSNTITIDLRNRLQAPRGLSSISLNRAVQLSWASNSVDNANGTFDFYRVYSTTYDATRSVCTAQWVLEGTTASDGFLIDHLTNGVTRCFAVSALSRTGQESEWSDVRLDTPRFDGRNVIIYTGAAQPSASSFLFYDDLTRYTGVVASYARADADFTIERNTDGSLWLTPARSGVSLMRFGTGPIVDLTAIDRAPQSGFATPALMARAGSGYVFRITKADGTHYAGLRVTYVGADHMIFEWSYQSAAGNPELSRAPVL